MAATAFQPFFQMLLVTFTSPGFVFVAAAAKLLSRLNQADWLRGMATAAGDTVVAVVLVHRLPVLTFSFVAKTA